MRVKIRILLVFDRTKHGIVNTIWHEISSTGYFLATRFILKSWHSKWRTQSSGSHSQNLWSIKLKIMLRNFQSTRWPMFCQNRKVKNRGSKTADHISWSVGPKWICGVADWEVQCQNRKIQNDRCKMVHYTLSSIKLAQNWYWKTWS